jgi:hypothetical protein
MRASVYSFLGAALCAAAVALPAPARADVCGCAGSPATLGAFDSADPDTWPTVGGQPTTQTGSTIVLPLPEDGILVFDSFTLSNLPAGGGNATLSFGRNLSNTPVRLLVAGDVVIGAGDTLSVRGSAGENGTSASGAGRGGLGGPGGFKGGDAAAPFFNEQTLGGHGFGPGGGAPGILPARPGSAGSYVGPADLLPLLGGSGGGGGSTTSTTSSGAGGGGGGGGGALLIAANGTLTVDGSIDATGGPAGSAANFTIGGTGGSGSGGALRLLADTVRGTGTLFARGGGGASGGTGTGGAGRIRVEAFTNEIAPASTDPVMRVTAAPGPLESPLSPSVAIVEVGGEAVAQPAIGFSGSLGSVDVIVPAPGLVPVRVETRYVPSGTRVDVVAKPRFGAVAPLAASTTLDTCQASGVCEGTADFNLVPGDYSIEAKATFEVP